MAIILLGRPTCPLCEKLLIEGEDIKGLPAISNTEHPLYRYFDQGFHLPCFDNWDKKEDVLNLIKEEMQKFKNSDYYKEMAAKYGKPKWLDHKRNS